MNDSAKAIEFYTRALQINGSSTYALRNRAGEYLKTKEYDKALSDYKLYISLDPDAYQKDSIEKVISLLENKLDEIAKRKLEEERRRLAEEKSSRNCLIRFSIH